MAVLRLGCFRAGPAGTGDMLARHAALAAADEDAFPGLTGMPLATAGARSWTGMWRRYPLASAQAALPARPASRRPGPHSRPPKAPRLDTRRSSMRDRTRPVYGKDVADPCGGRHARRRAWPAPPPRHRSVRVLAARRGGEQA
jgi:hypothetical protein